MQTFRTGLLNFLYFSFVFIVALVLSTLALARKVNTFKTHTPATLLSVEKDLITVTTPVGGQVKELYVHIGQHVEAGDTVVEITDQNLLDKLAALEEFADTNLSAKTEAELIRSQLEQYNIKAPRPGTIHSIETPQGTFVSGQSRLITFYADDDVKLTAHLDANQVERIQRSAQLPAYSNRLQRTYRIEFLGITQATSNTENYNQYKVIFSLSDIDAGQDLIPGETLEIFKVTSTNQRPSELLTNLWNSLILGE